MKQSTNSTINIVFAITVLSLLGYIFYNSNRSQAQKEIYIECTCPCHEKHEKELSKELKKLKEERENVLLEKAEESKKMMKKQEEETSRPFREFLKECKDKNP